jgi:hypothetical protein
MPNARLLVAASLLAAFSLLLVFLDEISHAIRAPVAVIAMSNEVSTSTLRMDSATSANSSSVDEARRLVSELESQSGDAERRSSRWAFFGVVLTVLAALAGYAAYRQAISENKINERLRKADQALADLLMEEQRTATAEANKEAARANERAATLEKEAAAARLELEQIENRQLQRRIPFMKLWALLIGARGDIDMSVTILSATDDESAMTAGQLRAAFQGAGWTVTRFERAKNLPFPGIAVYSRPDGEYEVDDRAPKIQKQVVGLLELAGLATSRAGDADWPPKNSLRIEVGVDPRFRPHGFMPQLEGGVVHEYAEIEPAPFPPEFVQPESERE